MIRRASNTVHAAPSVAVLDRLRPDFVVMNADYAERPGRFA